MENSSGIPGPGKFSFRKRAGSFGYAFHGLKMIIKTQHNVWIHLVISVMVIILGFIFRIGTGEWIAIAFAIGFVLAAEAFNTAVEFLVDLVSPGHHPQAGLVKDIAAGGVLIAAITAVVVGLIVFVPYL